ncbi:MAG TPA: DoxX family protein [Chitinophagales bacterium]|nr:DoxX family protein [Chitinophagales bacterium]
MKKLFDTNYNNTRLDIGLLLLRTLICVVMAFIGYEKLIHANDMIANDYWKTQVNFLGLGSAVSVWLTIFAEFFCSVFLMLGLFTRLSLIPLIFCMSYIVFVLDKFNIISHGEHGYEVSTAFVYLIIYVVLMLTGPGKLSVDKFLFNKNQ